ncbi:MAG: hypothetical protein IT262_03690 [Saprospiraceae bacterium]|nr:hypothetical protein [Saprospiraceae bacterium]
MKKILLHTFTVFVLACLVANDMYRCFDFPEGIEVYDCDEKTNDAKKENKVDDDTQGMSFKIKETDFYLSLTTIFAKRHVGNPECYSKWFHPSATLAIFVPPPNFG